MGLLDIWNKKEENNSMDTIQKAISENKSITISYRNFNGELSQRILSNIKFNNEFDEKGYHNEHVKGFCSKRQEERTFKIDRIITIKINE